MAKPLTVSFVAGAHGPWRIERLQPIAGETLPSAQRLAVIAGEKPASTDGPVWRLCGTISNTRYTHRGETDALTSRQQGLGRPEATQAALIPIRKSEAWWSLAQDERRTIFEETSHHIRIGLDYLPAVARRLHHARDLGEMFDFLTWFEFAPQDVGAFDHMLVRLRATEEWRYVEREVDIRLTRDGS